MATALSYEEKEFGEKARPYPLCMNDMCLRKEHLLRWLEVQWTPNDLRLVNVINPYYKDFVEGSCIDYHSDEKRRMARGMVNFYENIPEPKAKAIRKALIADLTKTKYFKFRNGTFPITPEDQAHIATICRANGWKEPLCLSTVTMKSKTFKIVSVSFDGAKPSVSQCETNGINNKTNGFSK